MKQVVQKLKRKWTLLSLLFLGIQTLAFSQGTIEGSVKDNSGDAVIGASIVLGGSTQGAPTDVNGNYRIENVEAGSYTLVVSSIGYLSQESEVTVVDGQPTIMNFDNLGLDLMELDDVIVTGVLNPRSKLSSSVSISTIGPKQMEQSVPRTTAEIFRTVPGIKVEASAGEGNTNMTARGAPISAGGSRYVQIQRDGLPVLLYGDMAFNTQDQYFRFDRTIERLEGVRGGSAATTTTNGPGAILNFISKTGAKKGGSVATTIGLDYDSYRTDFEYGDRIGEDMTFHIGGFARQGEGPRHAGYNANKGGQFRASLTKRFATGVATVEFLTLNDRVAAYMPMPIMVSGTNADPNWSSVPSFDAVSDGLQSPFFLSNFGLGGNGNAREVSISDGIHTKSNSLRASFEFDLFDGWSLSSNSRVSFNSGRFIAPFTAQVGTTADIMSAIVIANGDSTATGAALPYTINRVSSGTTITDTENGLVQRIHLFDVDLNNTSNVVSNTKVSKSFDRVEVAAGVFTMEQKYNTDWVWGSYLLEVGPEAELLNVNANGRDITDNGLLNYGVPLWGNCCTGGYDTNYKTTAPYLQVAVEATDNLNIDASIRYDKTKVTGTVTPSQQIDSLDVNGNGTIDAPERSVSRVDNANARVVNYDYGYVSYSVGVNYGLNDNSAVFARVSQGYVGNGERATWHQGGPYLGNRAPKNSLFQAEAGYKQRFTQGALSATAFFARTEEDAGVEATTQLAISSDYQAFGLELEGSYRIEGFDVRVMATYVNAEITDDKTGGDGGDWTGNTPRRQPTLAYTLMPSYTIKGGHSIGFTVIGQTKAYAQNSNELVMPGSNIVNGHISANLTDRLLASVNVNNLFNTKLITESENGSIVEGQVNYARARSVTGRSLALNLIFTF